MEIKEVLAEIQSLRDQHAAAALATPRGKKAFDYGQASGRYLAYQEMFETITNRLEEEAESDKRE